MAGRKAAPYSEHFLAAKGYVVFRPDLSEDLIRQPSAPLGGLTEATVAAASALVAAGIADTMRIGVVGISQGGFASLWLATQTNRFRAVASINGWSDMYFNYFDAEMEQKFYSDEAPFGSETSRYEGTAAVGGLNAIPWGNPEIFIKNSPLFYAGSVVSRDMWATLSRGVTARILLERCVAALSKRSHLRRHLRRS